MTPTTNNDAIIAALSELASDLTEKRERLDRIGAYMDDPAEPTIIVRVQHGKISDFAATDAITALTASELAELVNAVIFGAFCDWYEQVTTL